MGEAIDHERRKLYIEGQYLLWEIIDELNRVDVHGAHHSFRREEDMEEVCVALARFARKKGIQEAINNT